VIQGSAESGEAPGLRRLAVRLAREAGDILLATEAGRTQSKSSITDLVTDADRAAERHIFDGILSARPHDSVKAEEGSVNVGSSGIEWVVDPLDGTVNFVYDFPHWCVSIGVEGRVRLGVVHDPNRGETFTDADSFTPSGKTELADSLIATGFSYRADVRARQAEVTARVLPLVRDIRRAGSCALDLAWVACGRLDGYFEEDTRHWDVSAGIALIRSAGGFVQRHGTMTVAAGTEELLEKLEELVVP
jgi:myo-inositol-1(or 4)-monophosphatase